jgi:hypothetical protein
MIHSAARSLASAGVGDHAIESGQRIDCQRNHAQMCRHPESELAATGIVEREIFRRVFACSNPRPDW